MTPDFSSYGSHFQFTRALAPVLPCFRVYWNSDNSIVKTIAKSAKSSSVSNFGDNYRYLRYKYKIELIIWNLPLCKLHTCFDSYMSHNITVVLEGSFMRDLCLIRDDYMLEMGRNRY